MPLRRIYVISIIVTLGIEFILYKIQILNMMASTMWSVLDRPFSIDTFVIIFDILLGMVLFSFTFTGFKSNFDILIAKVN